MPLSHDIHNFIGDSTTSVLAFITLTVHNEGYLERGMYALAVAFLSRIGIKLIDRIWKMSIVVLHNRKRRREIERQRKNGREI